jgi:DNA repair protein RecO (recombination protein O)
MKQVGTSGIVLTRVDYGEADRILTFLTPDHGKITAIAKAVRKAKSKLAGGIELFSISEIGYIVGKSDINTLTYSRLQKHYGSIVKELPRTQTGYDVIKIVNKATEDNPEAGYFHLLEETFQALDDLQIDPKLTRLWFSMHLLKLAGHMPDLQTDINGAKLQAENSYEFEMEQMRFAPAGPERAGAFNADHVKFLRLAAAAERPHLLQRVSNAAQLIEATAGLAQSMLVSYVRV